METHSKYDGSCSECPWPLYAMPPETIAEALLASSWLAAHDATLRAETLREFADLVTEIAALGVNNTGLRTPEHLGEYARNYAARIAEGEA